MVDRQTGTALTRSRASSQRGRRPNLPSPDLVARARAQAFENVFDAVVVTDLAGIIVDWNAGSERLYGYPREEALGQPVSILHVPEDSEHLAAEVLDSVGREGRWQGEIRMLHRDGNVGWIESMVVPLTDDSGEPLGALGINRDISSRRRWEEELRAAEARFRSLVENSLVGIYIVLGDRLVYANPRLAEMFGYSQEDMLGKVRIFDMVVEEDREMVRSNVARRLAGEQLEEAYTFRAHRKDGTVIDVEVHGGRIELDGEHAVIGMARDVTDERRAVEDLRASEERLRLVARAVDDVIWEWNIDTGELVWGESAPRALRYAPEAMGSSIEWWYERIHPRERAQVITGLHTLLEGTEEAWSDEYRFMRGDGSYATMLDRGFVQRDGQGAPLRAIGSMMDITQRRREEDAQRLLARASSILDSSLEAEATLPGLARLLAPGFADLCRIDLFEEDGAARCVASAHVTPGMERAVSEGAPLATDDAGHPSPLARSVRAGDSTLIHEEEDGVPARIGEAGPAHDFWKRLEVRSLLVMPLIAQEHVMGALVLGMARSGRRFGPAEMLLVENLARRTTAALENARLFAMAQRAIRAREEILNVVSHDLRNPLSTVQMSADLLADGAQERREDHRKWLETITNAVGQMNWMIEDLLDAARIDQGAFSVDPSNHDVAALLAKVEQSFGPLASEKEIRLECIAPKDLPGVWLDALQIQRVLSNLIGNALKFTPKGGAIRVEAAQEGSAVRFSVSDTGPGIPQEELAHVFDRYWQARQGDRRGVGLGLAIAEGIVTAHGGRIWAESGEDEGAAFHFTLPVAEPAPGPSSKASPWISP
jgi:PAS domain S-box-containing protein